MYTVVVMTLKSVFVADFGMHTYPRRLSNSDPVMVVYVMWKKMYTLHQSIYKL